MAPGPPPTYGGTESVIDRLARGLVAAGHDVRLRRRGGRCRQVPTLGGAIALLNPIQWPEPFGLVMIEALATGTPVIATRRGAAPEIVRHGQTGFLADDHDSLGRAVRAVGRIDRRACRVDVARRFSAETMVTPHVMAYRGLLADGDPAITDSRPMANLT